MKKLITILLIIVFAVAFVSTAQIQRGKKPAHTSPKTEQTSKKPKQTVPSSNGGKSRKTNKASSQQSSSRYTESNSSNISNHSSLPSVVQQAIDDMVWVEGGTFTMGATEEQGSDAYFNEKPAHQVTLSGYYIGKYEVTQELWHALMGKNPSQFQGDSRRPVEMVSWYDCQEFLRKLNDLTGKRFRLPTEAEWEYAARGGKQSLGYKYSGSDNPGSVAWYGDNSGDTTHPVSQNSPNELGLYDMSGNVSEWCQDWYGDYSSASQTNPTGPTSGSVCVIRGGRWNFGARGCRVSDRSHSNPSNRLNGIGLRLAL